MSNLALQSERGRMNNGGDGGWVWKTRGGLHRSSNTVALEATVVAAASVTGSAGSNQGTPKGKGTREKKRDLFSLLPSSTTVVDDLPPPLVFVCLACVDNGGSDDDGGGRRRDNASHPTKKPRFCTFGHTNPTAMYAFSPQETRFACRNLIDMTLAGLNLPKIFL